MIGQIIIKIELIRLNRFAIINHFIWIGRVMTRREIFVTKHTHIYTTNIIGIVIFAIVINN